MYRAIIILFFITSATAHASDIAVLEQRNVSDVKGRNGSEYEMEVVKAFWGNPHFMMQCLPPGSPLHKPFSIYIEILNNGKIGQLEFTLNTEVTKCIKGFVEAKQFPEPKAPFVAKINMNFTE